MKIVEIELQTFMDAPLVDWEKLFIGLPTGRIQDIERMASAVAEKAARLSGYLEARGASGCGDNGHAAGVKESNRKAAKVRKALGYTYARQDISF